MVGIFAGEGIGLGCVREARWCFALTAAVLLGAVCSCSSERSCTFIFMPAVAVTVVDASGNPVCDVTVRIQSDQTDVQVDLTTSTCYASAGDQAGDYSVSVLRAGSELARQSVQVETGECGAVQQKVVVHLPAP